MSIWKYTAPLLAAGSLLFGLSAPAQAQDYPERAVTVIVGYAAGGGTDIYARMLSENLSKTLGAPFVVENRPGAATKIAAEAVAGAPADGYTLLFTTAAALVSNPHLYDEISYGPEDFAPISIVGVSPYTLVVRADFPAQTVDEVIEYVKAHPGDVTMGSLGVGSGPYLVGKGFEQSFDLDMIEVPYQGSAEAALDLTAGRIDMYFDGMTGATQLQNTGAGRIMAVMDEERSPALPDVPAIGELGHSELSLVNWFALLAPAGTPDAIVDKLNKAVVETVATKEFSEHLGKNGVAARSNSPAEFKAMIETGSVTWKKIIESLGIKLTD
jgi:tripartite-type tricarboxylate transporter receptor subunit TctC